MGDHPNRSVRKAAHQVVMQRWGGVRTWARLGLLGGGGAKGPSEWGGPLSRLAGNDAAWARAGEATKSFGTLAASGSREGAPWRRPFLANAGHLGRRHDCYPGAAGGFALLSRGIQSASGGDEGKSAAIDAQNLDLDLGAIGNLSEVVTSSIRDVELALIADSGYWTPVQACFKYFHLLHSTFDLPWVGAVAAGTIFARLLLLPVNIEQMRMAERMAVAKPDIDRLTAEAKEAAAKGGQDATHYSMEMQKLWKKHGVHPGRALGANLIVLPTMLLLPISILNLPKLGLPSLEAESFFWIQSVAVADPIYALPVASSALFFGAVHYNMSPESMTPQMQKILPIFKILPIAFLPVTVTLPALFHIFGITSVVFQTGQTTMLKNKSVREWLGFKPQISQVMQQIIQGPTPREVPAAAQQQQQPKQKQQKRKGRKNKRRKK